MKATVQNRGRLFPTLFDSGALITLAKFRVRGKLIIDYLVSCCRINIPPEVKHETVDMGLLFDYQDAMELEQRLSAGSIIVLNAARRDKRLEGVI